MKDKRSPTLTPSCLVVGILLALVPATGSAQQSDAEKLIEAGHWKKARTIVDARIRQSPSDPLSNYLLSQIHHAFGDDATPRALAEKAVSLEPRVAKYHRQFAETLGIEAQHASPIQLVFIARQFRKELDTAISLDPRDIQAQRDLLEYYLVAPGLAGGDIQKAAAAADHIAELDSAEGFLARARVAVVRKQFAQAETFLQKATEAQPPSYRALTELARFCLAREHADPGTAELAGREMLRLDRSRADSYTTLAEVYASRGDFAALDAILTESAEQLSDDLSPYYRAAEALLNNNREPARAERYLRTYLSQEPEGNEPPTADARHKLDLALRAQGRSILATAGPNGPEQRKQ